MRGKSKSKLSDQQQQSNEANLGQREARQDRNSHAERRRMGENPRRQLKSPTPSSLMPIAMAVSEPLSIVVRA